MRTKTKANPEDIARLEDEGRRIVDRIDKLDRERMALVDERDQWLTKRVVDGWTAYHCARVLRWAYPALRRRMDQLGIAYPGGGGRG